MTDIEARARAYAKRDGAYYGNDERVYLESATAEIELERKRILEAVEKLPPYRTMLHERFVLMDDLKKIIEGAVHER